MTFAKNMGAKQTITGDQIEFVGYGLQIPSANIDDYAKTDPKGKIVVWLGSNGPKHRRSGVAAPADRAQPSRDRQGRHRGVRAGVGIRLWTGGR